MPPTLLSLPSELRLQILHHALLPSPPSHPTNPDPSLINIEFRTARALARLGCHVYWGTSAMTALLLTNRQLLAEATDVLYKSFVFSWAPFPVRGFVLWADSLSAQARAAVRRVAFTAVLARVEAIAAARNAGEEEGLVWELKGLKLEDEVRGLRERLTGLREVRVRVAITNAPGHRLGVPVEELMGTRELEDAIMMVAGCFQGVEKVELESVTPQGWQGMFTQAVVGNCRRRIGLGQW
jgi:hypothetical protein